ncbi:MAG: hypothetical protein EOP09_19805, partial [Proteobacteria bacterium]
MKFAATTTIALALLAQTACTKKISTAEVEKAIRAQASETESSNVDVDAAKPETKKVVAPPELIQVDEDTIMV